MDFYENTKVTEIIDYKNSRVKKPNLLWDGFKMALAMFGIFFCGFMLIFSHEISALVRSL